MSNKDNNKPNTHFGAFPQQPAVSPVEARETRRRRRLPSDIVRVPNVDKVEKKSLTSGGNPLGIPSIPEQARALRNNVDLIYQYVHDNVEFIPTYGLHKGGLGALVDGSGNAFDQCDLMVKLLQQAGYTVEYVIGDILIGASQWSSWLGVDQNNLVGAVQLLANGGIACTGFVGTNQVLLDHCWVKVRIDGTDYYFDPAMKQHTLTSGINIANAINYNPAGQPTFLDDAKSGATIDPNGNSVRNINYGNINSKLASYSSNLINWIKQNAPGASFDEILGGRSIVPVSGTIRQTTLPYANSIDSVSSSLPDAYKAYFRFEYDAIPGTNPVQYRIDVAFWTADIYGQRLTLFWDGSGIASLRLNGTQYGNSSVAKAAGAMEDARFTVFHPYSSSFANVTAFSPIQGRAPTFIGSQFGVSSKYIAGVHQEIQNEYVAAGLAASSEPLLGTSLNLIWDNFIGQSSGGLDILSRLGNCSTVLHHFIGTVAQATKPGTSTQIKSVSGFLAGLSLSARSIGVDLTPTGFASSLVIQALEGTAGEQVTGVECGDAIKVLSVCNQAGVEIYDAKSSNWTTGINVRSILNNAGAGYNNTVLNEIESWINLGATWRVVVPNDPTVAIGAFTDFYGYLPLGPDRTSIFSKTWFGAKGAASAAGQGDSGTNSAAFDNARQVNGFGMPAVTAYESARVNMLNGRYEYSSTDLAVGNQGAPYELAFTRSYNSALRLSLSRISSADQGLGFGWTHNWLMKASVNSDGFIPLGDQQVSAAAPAIASLFVMRDVAATNTAMPVENFVVECEIATFLVKQFSKNVVRLQAGGSFLVFTRMPDGSYLPPLGAHGASLLTKHGTAPSEYFKYTTPDKVVYTYKTTGEIEKIEYPYGITINFTYTSGRLSKVSNGFREINFNYDGFGQLATVNDGNGRTVTLTIPSTGPLAGNLTSVQDPLNKATTYDYDQRGRLTKIFKPANPAAPLFTNTYDILSRVKEQKDAYNNVWQFFLAGSRSEEVAPNNTSRILYFNAKGNIVRTINALGQEVATQYDGNERPTLLTLPEENSVATTYDANGNVLVVTQQAKPGSGLADRTTSYTYETDWNKIATVTDSAGNTTSYEYYSAGSNGASQVKKITGPAVAAGTPITQFEYNNKGQLLKTTDPTGLVTSNTYEAIKNNLVATAVDPLGLNISSAFSYDAVGNTLTTTDPKGNVTTAVYDSNRRVTQVTGPAPFNQVAVVTYDDNGNVLQTQSLALTDPNSQVTKNTYAIDGKLLMVVGPDNYAQGAQPVPTRYEYDNLRRLSKVTNALGHVATTVYDALSRQLSSAIDGATQQTLAYTTNGQVLSVTDARNNTTEYQYDGFDRSTRTTYPDTTYEEVVSYDSRDNVIEARTRAGDLFEFSYDASSQLLSKTPAGQPVVSFTYDLAGRPLTIATPLVSGDPSTGTFRLYYDTAGRMFKEEYPDGKSVIAELDKNGNVSKLTYPDGTYVTHAFDTLDRLTSVSGFGGNVTLGYDTASRRSSQINANGTGQGYRFDKVDSSLSTGIGGLKFSSSPLQLPQVKFAFGYNDLGQIVSKKCNDDRFIWQPDASSTITYGTANSVNQYPDVDSVPFSYDGNGCLTDDGEKTYGYDVESRLLSVTGPASTVGYKYDPLGRLVEKAVGATKVRYLYSGLQRIEEYDGSGTLVRRYVYGTGLDECLYVVNAATGSITYLHSDETGSTVLTTDATGMPTGINAYTPWGELASGSLSDIQIGFTGQFYDPDAGLYFYKARHYSPELGRFLQSDPTGYEGGLNLYEYAGSDPVNFSDPLGMNPITLQGGVVYQDFAPIAPNTSGLYAGFAGMGGGSGPGGSYSIAEWTNLLTWSLYLRNLAASQAGIANQQAAAAAQQQQQQAAQAAAAAAQAAAIAAAVRKYQSQAVSAFDAIFGPGIQNIKGDPAGYAMAAMPLLGVARAAKIAASGRRGERLLAGIFRESEIRVPTFTPLGTRVNDLAHGAMVREAKVGRVGLNANVLKEVLKDSWQIRVGKKDVEWHFIRSLETGRIGPSKPLKALLHKLGIPYFYHR